MQRRTQVGILGAGPAGLMLSHLLHRAGIDSVVLESRDRDYVEHRVRAGVLEQGTVDLLDESGVGERMRREGLLHHGIELRFGGRGHRIDFPSLTGGRSIMVYGQQEVVKDLIRARLADGGTVLFDVSHAMPHGLDSGEPSIRYTHGGEEHTLACDFVAGCDGFHGVSRQSIPAGVITLFERVYPFAWLGILAKAAPTHDELIYAYHDRGFALYSMRSPEITRLYLQVAPDEDIGKWPDERIWQELHTRLETDDGWKLIEGPVLEKGVTGMRSFVAEPMQYGRLFLAGDAAHIVPPTGAKGMNLAMADVRTLSLALAEFYRGGREERLAAYSQTCLARVWRAEHFSWWMTSMLHRFPDDDGFGHRLQRSQLDYVTSSRQAAASLAENYVGLPFADASIGIPVMINKIVRSAEAAVADIPDGATVLIGGFGTAGMPSELIDALIAQGARDLTIVNNNAGNGDTGLAALLKTKRVRKVLCSFPRQTDSHVFDALYRAGQIELELVPQGNLAERIRAAGSGIGAFFSPTGFGTLLAEGKETRVIDGRNYVLEYPIRGDFAFVKALRGDRWGNLVYRKTARNFGPIMAAAAKCTIAQVREIVNLGDLDPEAVVTPGIFVNRVVEIPVAARIAEAPGAAA